MDTPETPFTLPQHLKDWLQCIFARPVTCSVRFVGVLLIILAVSGLVGAVFGIGSTGTGGEPRMDLVTPLGFFAVGLLFLAPDLPRMAIAMFLLFVFLTSTLLLIIPVKDVVGIVAQNKGVGIEGPGKASATPGVGGETAPGKSVSITVTTASGEIEVRPGMVARNKKGELLTLYPGKQEAEALRSGSILRLGGGTRKEEVKGLGQGKGKWHGKGKKTGYFFYRNGKLLTLPNNYFLGTIRDGDLHTVVFKSGLRAASDLLVAEAAFDVAYLVDFLPGRFISINNGILTSYRPEEGFGVPLSREGAVHVWQRGEEVEFTWLDTGDEFVVGSERFMFQSGVISSSHGGSGTPRKADDTTDQIYSVLLRNLDKAVPIILAILMGALGSAVVISRTFVADYDSKKPLWYFYRLFQGMVMAILVIFGFSAGMLSVTTASFESGGPLDASNYEKTKYLIGFASALAGLFSDRAFNKLAEISQTMFGSPDTATPGAAASGAGTTGAGTLKP